MVKKFLLVFIVCIGLIISIELVSAESWSSNNNPGKSNTGTTNNGGASGSTLWPSPFLQAVRIRVFRGSTKIVSDYLILGESVDDCYGSYGKLMLCETSSYNYSKISNANSTCQSKDVSFGCITFTGASKTFRSKAATYDGTILNNYFIDDNTYGNLKDTLTSIGYYESDYRSGDVVIVEPATIVKCDGSLYFGTVVSLMNQNISYKGGNVCGSDDSFNGYAFNNLFQNMANSLKENEGSFYYANDTFSGFGYFKYNVSDLIDTGKLIITKKNSVTKQPISSSSAYFQLYKGADCSSGNTIGEPQETSSGIVTFSGLEVNETYSVYESIVPNKYEAPKDRCVIKGVTITSAGQIIYKDVENEPTCEVELDDLISAGTATPTNLIKLYDKYKNQKGLDYRDLLNFDSPFCTNTVSCGELDVGCLSASKETVGGAAFTVNNLSCYDGSPIFTKINQVDGAGNVYVTDLMYGFCKNQLIVNNIFAGVTKFYSKNGQFLIRELNEEGKIQYYSLINAAEKKIKLEEIDSDHIVNAIVSKQCYFLKGHAIKEQEPESLDLYFGDNNDDGTPEKLNGKKVEEEPVTTYSTYFNGVNYIDRIYFSFDPVNIDKLSGKINDEAGPSTIKLHGVVSKFDDEVTSGIIPFKVKFTEEEKTSNECTFETFSEIIDPDLELEFRIIDTTNPFVGKSGNYRNTKTNWCYYTNYNDDKDCNYDNDVVKQTIINATNSYGMKEGNRQDPIYEITLTSADIKLIRQYNDENEYDNYEMYCNGEENCVNAFVYDLKNGTLKKYDTENFVSVPDVVYGSLSSNLITN